MKQNRLKTIYFLSAVGCALVGTATLAVGIIFLWPIFAIASNVFFAAGTVCGTCEQAVKKFNPKSRFSQEEPETVEARVYRIPGFPILVALAGALIAGLFFQSALWGLLMFLTWGGYGYPLALCVLYRTDYGFAMQMGLLATSAYTGIAGVIQVFLSSPGHTFQLDYCFDRFFSMISQVFTEALLQVQAAGLLEEMKVTGSPQEIAASLTKMLLQQGPAYFAIGTLLLLSVVWWGLKTALKRNPSTEVSYMGRIDTYVPNKIVPILFMGAVFLNFVLNLLSQSGSGLQVAMMNIVIVLSAVLAFSGFSLILYIVNTRVGNPVLRILLILGALWAGLSSCGGVLLVFLGVLTVSRNLRVVLGGDSLK